MENSGRGGYRFLMTRMGWKEESLERVAIITAMAHMLMGKEVRAARVKGEEEMVVEFVECPFEDAPLEVCVGLCYQIIRGVAKEYGSDYEGDLFKMIKHGDPYCAKGVVRKDLPPSAAPWKELNCSIDFMSQEERDFFFNAYITQFWYDCVKAFNDMKDERTTVSILAPRMKAFGMSVGLEMKRDLGLSQGRAARGRRSTGAPMPGAGDGHRGRGHGQCRHQVVPVRRSAEPGMPSVRRLPGRDGAGRSCGWRPGLSARYRWEGDEVHLDPLLMFSQEEGVMRADN